MLCPKCNNDAVECRSWLFGRVSWREPLFDVEFLHTCTRLECDYRAFAKAGLMEGTRKVTLGLVEEMKLQAAEEPRCPLCSRAWYAGRAYTVWADDGSDYYDGCTVTGPMRSQPESLFER